MKCQQQFIFHHCAACLRAQRLRAISSRDGRIIRTRAFSAGLRVLSQHKQTEKKSGQEKKNGTSGAEEGAMSRRLSEMADESMLEGGKSFRKNMQEAGFSEDLKKKLEKRIAQSSFRSENAAAFSLVNMPAIAGRGTQDIAAAAPWAGTESIHDVSLRMLDDASKPMRVPFEPPQPGPKNLQGAVKKSLSSGERLAAARDRTSTYALSQDPNMSEQEREAIRRELKERFTPSARAITPHGLSSLANERIEDAIARGQFRSIRRGKGINVECDHNASSPYIDTTEYLLNKIIQKQDITPPWIEKQQELAKEVERFRKRLRSDWRRHAVQLIASQGGSLESQIWRARGYAAAEARLGNNGANGLHGATVNEFAGGMDTEIEYRTQTEHEGRLSRTSSSFSPSSPQPSSELPQTLPPQPPITIEPMAKAPGSNDTANNPPPEAQPLPFVPPLRDPAYLKIEEAYLNLAVKSLNALARSYNLMAPPVAQKPYLKLERELLSCYADVTPSLPAELQRRATERPHDSSPNIPQRSHEGGLLKNLALRQNVRLHEEDPSKRYGFKQFWRDLWNRNDTAAG
ncbi:hypothetical protein EMCG_02103 [[Emmonsia] crescens]|uniref:DnaJ homologue subfamily C member 28 conserved domain-containing protein n=1 Tax=[Emmonsia] crescens TaxID=73230 RepID=A0A0G2J990_9EURO|nr:hypothetical protein EMCG_02103 [Emmonsia crescens UAMH 3008]